MSSAIALLENDGLRDRAGTAIDLLHTDTGT
jgi:hypothetical protein